MAAFILVVGLLNFVLGYLLALALADPPLLGLLNGAFWLHAWKGIKAGLQRRPMPLEIEEPPPMPEESDAFVGPTTVAMLSELPEQWQQVLREDGITSGFLASSVAHLLRLEGGVYRDHLLTMEARARKALAAQDPPAMDQLSADLRFINVDWARKQRQGADLIEERIGRLGAAEEPALRLGQLLRDQAAQIAEIDREVHVLDFRAEGTLGCRRLLLEMQQLVHLAHRLRDETTICLAEMLRREGELGKLPPQFHYDVPTGMLCRLGLEARFAEATAGARPTVAMHINLDRFGRVNQRLGSRVGDEALKAIGQLIAELAVAGTGKNLVVRQAGCEFLIFSEDQTVEELSSTGELIRQSFEATGFTCQGTEFSVTLTISIAAIAADDTLDDILVRLRDVSAAAIKAGHNRCARWENGAATLTIPAPVPIQARVIPLETTAA